MQHLSVFNIQVVISDYKKGAVPFRGATPLSLSYQLAVMIVLLGLIVKRKFYFWQKYLKINRFPLEKLVEFSLLTE
ncbi:MAG TPA: hypothetical protein DCQ87_00130 [Lachnospiraceae bacterium]|nr:hypothetical protein [Lachnospiraceae bacterium]